MKVMNVLINLIFYSRFQNISWQNNHSTERIKKIMSGCFYCGEQADGICLCQIGKGSRTFFLVAK